MDELLTAGRVGAMGATIVAVWAVMGLAFVGWGLALQRLAGVRTASFELGMSAFWAGLSLVVLGLQIWHFVAPVTGLTTGTVIAIGLVACGRLGADHARLLGDAWRRHRLVLIALVLLLFWAAFQATPTPQLVDTAVYHAQAVRWNTELAVVPGLANLQGRLGFNNSGLLYAALFDQGPLTGRGVHFANGLLLATLLVQVVWSLRTLFTETSADRRAPLILWVLLLTPVVDCVLGGDLNSYSTDLHASALLVVSGWHLFRVLAVRSEAGDETWWLVATSATASLAVVFKLSSLPFVAPALATVWFVHVYRRWRANPFASLAPAVAIAALLIGPWAVRGIVISGYPFYPIAALAAPVPWRVPVEQARAEVAWIRHHARYVSNTRLGVANDWYPLWRQRLFSRRFLWPRFVLPLALLAVVPFAAAWRRRQGPVAAGGAGWLALAPVVAGLVAWFVAAPAIRFVWAYAWLLTAIPLALLVARVSRFTGGAARLVVGVAIALALVPPTIIVFGTAPASRSLGDRLLRLVVPVQESTVFLPAMPRPTHERYVTRSGLAVAVGHPPQGRCWDIPIPCTGTLSPNLRLRDPDRLGAGFELAGPWEPIGFPNGVSRYLEFWRCADERAGDEAWARRCLARFGGSDSGADDPDNKRQGPVEAPPRSAGAAGTAHHDPARPGRGRRWPLPSAPDGRRASRPDPAQLQRQSTRGWLLVAGA